MSTDGSEVKRIMEAYFRQLQDGASLTSVDIARINADTLALIEKVFDEPAPGQEKT